MSIQFKDIRNLRLLHISDLHFLSTHQWPPLDGNEPWASRLLALRDDVKSMRPDLIAVTGDIADNNAWEAAEGDLRLAWRNALTFLGDLCSVAHLDPEHRLFVVPGNHDVKVLGNISRSTIRKLNGHWALRAGRRALLFGLGMAAAALKAKDLLDEARLNKLIGDAVLERLQVDGGDFRKIFAPHVRSRAVDDLQVCVFCVDSNAPADPTLNFAQGIVTAAEGRALQSAASEMEERLNSRYATFDKIVLVHHHPMPMPHLGPGGVTDSDAFNLLRNANAFLGACVQLRADVVLHGHKHVGGASLVALPSAASGERHSMAVVGAASVQQALGAVCGYNLLRRSASREWSLETRTRSETAEGIARYQKAGEVRLLSGEQFRRRLFEAGQAEIHVGRLSVQGSIELNGNLTLSFLAQRVAPADAEAELWRYPVFLASEAKRATHRAEGVKDEDKRDHVLSGYVLLDKPARRADPKDVSYELTGVGMFAFTQEYCRWYKGDATESVIFGISKRYEELCLDIDFPDEFPPLRARLEVFRLTDPSKHLDEEEKWEELVRRGDGYLDVAETNRWSPHLRVLGKPHRLSLRVVRPLLGCHYRIAWDLQVDEYEVLRREWGDAEEPRRMKRTIGELHRRMLGARIGDAHFRAMERFLRDCGEAVLKEFGADENVRIDWAVNKSGEVTVCCAAERDAGVWNNTSIRPVCRMAETLRGKAYFCREVMYLARGGEHSDKDPSLTPAETDVQHQFSIPIFYPEEPDEFMPRIGVLTMSSTAWTSELFEALRGEPERLLDIFQAARGNMIELAAQLGAPVR